MVYIVIKNNAKNLKIQLLRKLYGFKVRLLLQHNFMGKASAGPTRLLSILITDKLCFAFLSSFFLFCFTSLTFILREAILLLMIKIVLNYCSNNLFSTFAKYPEFFNKSYLGGVTLYNKVATIRHMLIP